MAKRALSRLVWLAIVALSLAPVLVWLLIQPLSTRFDGAFRIFTSFGQLVSLVGFVLMATVIILAARLRLVERGMRGLNHVFINHHRLGVIAFILLLAHPIFLAFSYLTFSTNAAALFLVPSLTAWPQALGTLALLLMVVLLGITFYLSWRYEAWKFSHRFLALAFLIAFFHVAFISSDVSRSLALRFYLLSLGALALIAYGYRLLVEFGHWGKYYYVVTGVREVATKIWEISLMPLAQPLAYQAGQFAFFDFTDPVFSGENHPFSFVSLPGEAEVKIATKALGDYTEKLAGLKVGTTVRLEGPYGAFGESPAGQAEIWVAGGIGITPFVGLAKSLLGDSQRKAELFYSVRNEGEAAYLDDLATLAKNAPNFKFIPYFSDKSGLLTANQIEAVSGPLADRCFYLCGPAPMMRSLKEQLLVKGVSASKIKTEQFKLD
ncbi:MAG: ferredoxin reductase family protein [Candidatus Paceibacterota bacterium]|jgi:predicted ferric reductase